MNTVSDIALITHKICNFTTDSGYCNIWYTTMMT